MLLDSSDWIRSISRFGGCRAENGSVLSPSLTSHVLGIPKDIDVAASRSRTLTNIVHVR